MKDLAALQTIALLVFTFVLCWFWQPNKHRAKGNLGISVLVIAMACIHAKYLIDLSELIDLVASKGIASKEEAAEARVATTIWAGVASLAIGGVGVNLLSSWFDS